MSSTIKDSSGNALGGSGTSFSFTTAFAPDTTAPQVLGVSPTNGATAVPLNALVVLTFSKPLDPVSVSTGFQVEDAGQPVAGGMALSNGNQQITFTPQGGLAANTTYTVVVPAQITDVGGLALANPATFTFVSGTATDATTPSVTLVSPGNYAVGLPTNGEVQIQFNKPIDPLTVTSTTFQVSPNGSGIPAAVGTISVSPNGQTATFSPSAPLDSATLYVVVASNGITDIEGHALASFESFFTTGLGTDTTAPTVTMVSPANGQSGTPVNIRVDVVTSAQLSAASVGTNAITLSIGGTQITGTVSLSSSGTTLTFVPATQLSVSTTYTVTVSGATDQAGNAVVPFTSSFSTGTSSATNTTVPAVVSVSPVNGASGVAVGSPIVLTFNEPIDLTTVSDTTVPIAVNGYGGALAGTYSLDATGTLVTFTPTSPLPGNATITVQMSSSGVADLSGNLSHSFYSAFTTGSEGSTTAPTVVMVTPQNQATGIGPSALVVLTFSESLNASTINANNFGLFVNGTAQAVSISVSADNRVVTLNPGGLPVSSNVSVVVTSAVTDLFGNPLANFESQFMTGPTLSRTVPIVVSQRPGNGATGVPLNESVVLYLSQPMNSASVTGALHVAQNGVLVSGTTQVTDNGQVVQFLPSASLQVSQPVLVYLDATAQGSNGVNMNGYQSSFTTQANNSAAAPSQISNNPAGNALNVPTNVVMDMAFSAALDSTTLTPTTVVCNQNGAWFQSEVSLVNGGTVVQVVPRSPLQPNTLISCQVSTSLQGLNGVPSLGGDVVFTTGSSPDTVVPTIVAFSPPNGSTNVGDNASIRLLFSKPINPVTVNSSTIQISGGGTSVVPDSISFSNNNQMVLLVPHAPLPDSTVMTMTLSGITDVAGNAVAPQTTQFTTGAGPDVVAPILLWTSPLEQNAYQAPTNVPLNAVVQLEVNEPVDPGTVNSTTFSVTNTSNIPVAGTYSVSADGHTITFVPSAPFAAGLQYNVNSLSGGITDLAGNGLSSAAGSVIGNFNFTTGTTSSTNSPQVTAVSPANGATTIPINARAAVGFNEPIDAAKVGGITLTGPGGTVAVSQTASNGNQTITLIPVSPLAAGSLYTVNITGVQDLSGNVIASPMTTTFTTANSADLVPPKETSTTPANYGTGVSTTGTVQVQFSKVIDPLTVTPATFYMYPYSTSVLVPGTLSVSTGGTTATFTPSEPLDSQTFYSVQLTTGITDMEGQSLSGTASFYFTTGQGSTSLVPNIATVTPVAGARAGASVTIDGTYFGTTQGSSTVTFNGTPATATTWNDVQIVVTVPSAASTGPLVVTVNGVSSNSVEYTILATPNITSISPTSATAGTVVTITGTNFGDPQDTSSVQFASNNYPTPQVSPLSRTPTSITVTVPSTTVTGETYVFTDGLQSNGVNFTLIPSPTISSLSPSSGVAGTPVGISGTNFGSTQGSSTLSFNGVPPSSITSWSNTYVVATPPSNVTTGAVTMVVGSIPSNNNAVFTVTDPAIGSLSPPSGAVGSTITVTGSGLTSQGLTTQVLFNGIAGYVTSSSSNSVSVQVPTNATTGSVTVEVGTVTSNSVSFTVEQPPTITYVSPNEGPFGGLSGVISLITIGGSGFGATQSNSNVNFWGSTTAPSIQSWSDSAITLYVPGDALTGPLTVQVGGLTATAPSWFTVNQVTQLTDSFGNQTQYSFGMLGGAWFTSISQGPGCSTCSVRGNISNVSDANGNLLTSTDDLSNTTTYTYDSSNDMTSASKPLNANATATTSYTHNTFGEVLTMTDPLGNVTTNTYDTHGNLLTVTTPKPNSNTTASLTQFQYATNGELTQITDPLNNVTKLTYNSVGLIATITDAQQNVTTYQYDTRGNRTAVIDPINGASHPTSFAYDLMNRLTGITYPDNSTVSFTYDVRGRRITATDQNNKTTTYTYDDADRLTAVTDPATNTTQYAYDTEDNLLSITDANNHVTQFAYNARGWVTQTTFPSTLAESYTYDLVGNLLSKTDRKSQTIQYVYDALYRLSSKTYPDTTAVEYAYDLAGK
jgi:YD repeat-containing protein